MDNGAIVTEHSLAEQHPHGDNQQQENLTQNQSDSTRSKNVIPMAKKGPMQPTPLEYSCWSRHRTATVAGVYALLASLAITVAVLVVCLTPRKAPKRECVFVMRPTVQYSGRDSSHPQSVAVSDFNNDGQMDIVVANFGFDNVSIFLGYGNNTFAIQTATFTNIGSAPRMVAVGDFNNDNRSDIAIANFGINSIEILFGDGDGNFPNRATIDTTPSRPLYIAVGDFNNDGCSDMVFAGYGTDNLGILLGFGNGNFRKRISFSTGYDSLPYSLALGDFNNDSQLDIAVGNSGTDNVGILLGYGNGTFAIQTTYTTGAGSHPYSIAISDLNNDTHLDIAVANSKADSFSVFYGHGNGSFTFPTFYSTEMSSDPVFIVIADFNNDKKPDITIANNGSDSVALVFGYANGTFANPIIYSTGPLSNPCSLGVADFNSDGQLDIAIVNQQNNNIKIFNSYTNETFAKQTTFRTSKHPYPTGIFVSSTGSGSYPTSIVVGDFNSDGRLDIAIANYQTDNICVLLGYGDGEFSSPMFYQTGTKSGPMAVAVGDFNTDGRLDIAVANSGTGNVGILLGYGDGTFSSQTNYPTGNSSASSSLAVGDFNGDGQLDIAVSNYLTNNVGVLLGYGDGKFSSQTIYSTGDNSQPYALAMGDFNDDGRPDIAVVNYGANNVGVLLGYGDGRFSPQMIHSTGSNSYPFGIVIGDFNNDSRLDIAIINHGPNNVGILLGYGDGNFSHQMNYPTGDGSQPSALAIGDFNGDRHVDIAVANPGTDNIGVLLGYGNGEFLPQMIYSTGTQSHPISVAVADLNNDGQLDIAVTNCVANNVVVLLGQGRGIFPHIVDLPNPYLCPMSVAIGDFNNDSQLDIAVANYLTDKIGILLGYGNGTFESQPAYSTGYSSHPISIIVDDFSSDGRLDIAVANYGINSVGILLGYGNGKFSSQTKYSTGNNSQPYALAIGDFNGDGRLDIAVANFGMNNVGVLLGNGNGEFSAQIIFSTGNDSLPTGIVVGDFNNDGRLDIAVANSNLYNVGILFGHGNGSFRSQTTFSTGVFSLPRTLVVGDFNNDGNLDIVVGNAQDAEENALILLGNGDGNFSSEGKYLTAAGSRLCSVVVGNFNNDSRLDFAVANNRNHTIGIFLGSGDGTFSNETTYPTSDDSSAVSIAAGDFNHDNLTDLAVANYETYSIGVFLAFIDTNFVDKTTVSIGSAASPGAIALGDFTNDGQLDIVVGNHGTHSICILINDENRSFSMQTVYSADSTFYPVSIIATDFNNDNRLDLAVASSATDSVTLLFGEGNGTFGNDTTYSTGRNSNPKCVAIGDFNNDNRTDIVIAHSGTGSVGVLLKVDNGGLDLLKTFSTGFGSKPHGLAIGDFNSDGHLDITVANNGNADIGFFFGFGNGTFSDQSTVSVSEEVFPTWVGVGDFNNDKQLDVILANNIPPTSVVILLGEGDGSFRIQTISDIGSTIAGAIGDFNNDGHPDVVFCQYDDNSIAVLLGYGDGTFRNPAIYSTGDGSYPLSITVGDFNNDGSIDAAVANCQSFSIGILLGDGNGTFSSQINYNMFGYGCPDSIAAGDFNNDSRLDVVVGIYGMSSICVLFGYGDGTLSSPITYFIDGQNSQSIYVVDFNNDGRLDIIVTNSDSGNLGILLGHVNGTFFNQITYSTGENSYPYSIGVGDFNNDGRLDITVSNMISDNIGVFLGHVSESFVSTAAYPIGDSSQPVSVAVGDFNNDTNMDVVVADRGTNEIVILHGSGDGTFSSHDSYSTGNESNPNWVAVGDFNQDKQLDIVVVNSGTNEIAVFLGYGNGTFSGPKMYSTGYSSLPLSLTVGYFDNDTQLDIAVANADSGNVCVLRGYGNGSFASPLYFISGFESHPSTVAFGDLTGDGLFDVVVCKSGYSSIEILTKIC